MAFFDNISRKISEAGQKTLSKTKELVDTSRINSMISEKEKIINNSYFQIGKLYVSIHGEDYEEDFAGMISTIAFAEEMIKEYRKQIQDIKGVQRCEKCGAEVSNAAAYCSACGAVMPKVQAPASDDYMKCNSCGANVKKGMRFCTSCGKPMIAIPIRKSFDNDSQRTCQNCGAVLADGMAFCMECGVAVETNAVPPAEVPAPMLKKGCPNCGAVIEENMAFCMECGTPLGTPDEAERRICPNCGAVLEDDVVFCTECGVKLE